MVHTQIVAAPVAKLRWKRVALALTIIVLAVAIAWRQHGPILERVANWWGVSDQPQYADAIVVLGGGTTFRPAAAAALYRQGFASNILISNPSGMGTGPPASQPDRDILLELGVPAKAIADFGENPSSTYDEAVAIRDWAKASHARRIIVPTGVFSVRRTRWIFERELAPAGVDVLVVALQSPNYTLADWWRHRSGRNEFQREVLKYLYYRIKY
jgi:uncharacterized SAM-binding protein YcdF (DUF218 family)